MGGGKKEKGKLEKFQRTPLFTFSASPRDSSETGIRGGKKGGGEKKKDLSSMTISIDKAYLLEAKRWIQEFREGREMKKREKKKKSFFCLTNSKDI